MMDRDSITRTGARVPGVERQKPLERRCSSASLFPGTERGVKAIGEGHEGRTQTARRDALAVDGKAPSDIPALKPY